MIPINGDFILSIAPIYSGARSESQSRIVGEVSAILAPTLDQYEINTALRIAHFIAQITHECAGFCTTEEFASGAAYEGRVDLGNLEKGDGKRFKGRGLIQLTGRANYRDIGKKLNLPLEEYPELAAQAIVSLKIACEYWKTRAINVAADQDNLVKVTKLVNGGTNGIKQRREYLQKAKAALANIEGLRIALNEGGNTTVLRRGSFGTGVVELQELLVSKGLDMSIDGDFGPATELAVRVFQKNNDLVVDGIVGRNVWGALRK